MSELKQGIDIVDVVGSFVTLQKRGVEFVGLCPFHADNNASFYVNQQKQIAHCFSCGWPHKKGGDVFDFIQDHLGLDFKAAKKHLGAATWEPKFERRSEARTSSDRVTCRPPEDGGTPDMLLRSLDGVKLETPVKASFLYPFHDLDGTVCGWEARYDLPGRAKEIRLWTYGARDGQKARWGCGHFTRPRLLYGLDKLVASPDAQVVVCEAPKKAFAVQLLMPDKVAVAWTGGASAWKHHDWEPLLLGAHRPPIILWPDADTQKVKEGQADRFGLPVGSFVPYEEQPGQSAMIALARYLQNSRGYNLDVAAVHVSDKRDGWDAADALEEGWTSEQTRQWVKARLRRVK